MVDEDGLTEVEQLIAEALWGEYGDVNGNPIVTVREDPRTVAHLLKPFLARVWDDAVDTTGVEYATGFVPDNPYLDFND